MEGGAIGNAWHASQVTYTWDKEGRQGKSKFKKQKAESKMTAKRLARIKNRVGFSGTGVSFFGCMI
jgi:predicted DNA-binding WGR domain protein